MGDEDLAVRIAGWKDHADNLKVDSLNDKYKGQAFVITSLRVALGNEGTTDLGTFKRTCCIPPSADIAATLHNRTRPKAGLNVQTV